MTRSSNRDRCPGTELLAGLLCSDTSSISNQRRCLYRMVDSAWGLVGVVLLKTLILMTPAVFLVLLTLGFRPDASPGALLLVLLILLAVVIFLSYRSADLYLNTARQSRLPPESLTNKRLLVLRHGLDLPPKVSIGWDFKDIREDLEDFDCAVQAAMVFDVMKIQEPLVVVTRPEAYGLPSLETIREEVQTAFTEDVGEAVASARAKGSIQLQGDADLSRGLAKWLSGIAERNVGSFHPEQGSPTIGKSTEPIECNSADDSPTERLGLAPDQPARSCGKVSRYPIELAVFSGFVAGCWFYTRNAHRDPRRAGRLLKISMAWGLVQTGTAAILVAWLMYLWLAMK